MLQNCIFISSNVASTAMSIVTCFFLALVIGNNISDDVYGAFCEIIIISYQHCTFGTT